MKSYDYVNSFKNQFRKTGTWDGITEERFGGRTEGRNAEYNVTSCFSKRRGTKKYIGRIRVKLEQSQNTTTLAEEKHKFNTHAHKPTAVH